MLTLSKGRGRWEFSHKPELIQKRCMIGNVKVANDGCDFHSFSTMCIATVYAAANDVACSKRSDSRARCSDGGVQVKNCTWGK